MLRRWRGIWARRGQFLKVPSAPQAIPGLVEQSGSRPRWAALFRRCRFFPNPAASAAPGPVQRSGRAVRRLPSVRRGERFDPPWAQVTQVPSVWSPPTIQAARRLAGRPARRGRFIEPPWPQAVAAGPPAFVPRLLAAHRPQPGTPRRAHLPWVPPGQGQPPAFVCTRRRTGGLARRGRLLDPPWTQVAAQPSVWRPGPVTARRRAPALPRIHGRRFDPAWPFVPPPPFSVGVLTATDKTAAALTAAGAGGPTVATDSTGQGTAVDQATGTLTATDKAGGPS